MNLDVLEYNERKRLELIDKIKNSNGNYLLFLIDVDDVIYNTEPVMQKILERIDYRATNKYRTEISGDNSEDLQFESELSFSILNAILEETALEIYNERKNKFEQNSFKKIDYNEIYQDENLTSNSIEYINHMIERRKFLKENIFFVACSHRNPFREGILKMQTLYKKIDGLDLVITLPFHVEPGSKEMNMKSDFVRNLLYLDDLQNVVLIDNSKTNCLDMRRKGGYDIRYLPNGYNEKHTIADRFSKITSLDPHLIAFALSYIRYAREHPEYIDEIESPSETKKIKKL